MGKVHDLLDRDKAMFERKEAWKPYWQILGDVLMPNRADFTTGHQRGARRNEQS